MISARFSLSGMGPRLLAVLIVCLMPTVSWAQYVVFQNDYKDAVVVQSESMVKGVLRRDRPLLLRCGASTPKARFDCDKTITIYDAKNPNRILYQGQVRQSSMDRIFNIVPASVTSRTVTPRVDLRLLRSAP